MRRHHRLGLAIVASLSFVAAAALTLPAGPGSEEPVESAEPAPVTPAPAAATSPGAADATAPAPLCASESRFDLNECLSESITADVTSLRSALERAHTEMERDDQFALECHGTFHEIGQATARQIEVADAVGSVTMTCQGGFLHGLIEGLGSQMSTGEFSQLIPDLCIPGRDDSWSTEVPGTGQPCWHAVGHGAAEASPDDLDEAFGVCDTALALDENRQDCAAGVLMAYQGQYVQWAFEGRPEPRPAHVLSAADVDALCTATPAARYPLQCADYVVGFWAGEATTLDVAGQLLERCGTLDQVERCAHNAGKWAWEVPGRDPDGAFTVCEQASGAIRETCLSGVVRAHTESWRAAGLPADSPCERIAPDMRAMCVEHEAQVVDSVEPPRPPGT